jgi:hypothetical protein
MNHYSARLGRNFEDSDWLFYQEVLEVLSANSGYVVPRTNVGSLVDHGVLHPRKLAGTRRATNLYQYAEVKNVVVARGRGRRAKVADTPGAIRARRFRERRRGTLPRKMEESCNGCC